MVVNNVIVIMGQVAVNGLWRLLAVLLSWLASWHNLSAFGTTIFKDRIVTAPTHPLSVYPRTAQSRS